MIRTIHAGCPFCGGDLVGSQRERYYCRHCNLLFRRQDVLLARAREKVRSLVEAHFEIDHERIEAIYSGPGYAPIRFVKDTSLLAEHMSRGFASPEAIERLLPH